MNQSQSRAWVYPKRGTRSSFSPGERAKVPRPRERERVAKGRVRVEGKSRLLRVRAGVIHTHFPVRFMGSPLFLFDLLTAHEPKMRKCLEINKRIFRSMGSPHGLLPHIGTMNQLRCLGARTFLSALWGGRGNTDMLVGLGSSWARGRTRMSALRFKERAHTAFPQTKALHRPDHGQP